MDAMNERDWGRLIRDTKVGIQKEAEERNKVVHHRINEAVTAIEKSRDAIIEVGNNMAAINAELAHRPDGGQMERCVNNAVNGHEIQFHDVSGVVHNPSTDNAEERVIKWAVAKIAAYIGAGGVSVVGLQKLAEIIFST